MRTERVTPVRLKSERSLTLDPQIVQVRLTSAVELIRSTLEPYGPWMEQMLVCGMRESMF